jgi:hypothetical protein
MGRPSEVSESYDRQIKVSTQGAFSTAVSEPPALKEGCSPSRSFLQGSLFYITEKNQQCYAQIENKGRSRPGRGNWGKKSIALSWGSLLGPVS